MVEFRDYDDDVVRFCHDVNVPRITYLRSLRSTLNKFVQWNPFQVRYYLVHSAVHSSVLCAGVSVGIHSKWLNMGHLRRATVTDMLCSASLEIMLSGQWCYESAQW